MSVLDEIKSRLDILDVVSPHASLQRSGRSLRGLCPFHSEKTPSFFVFPERQSWRCFGACATGGDAFSFIMRVEGLEFRDALKRLAQQAGVNLPGKTGLRKDSDALVQINEQAKGFFRNLLKSGKGSSARAYLEQRGLTQEAVDKFELGLSPDDWESLRNHLVFNGWDQGKLSLSGVVTKGRDGSCRDLFNGRLIFPIRDADGLLVGFGGRALDGSMPKYLNTPRTPIFDKGSLLYSLHLAKDNIRDNGAVIVEGYMDAIVAHQHGFTNVVASMGTALTHQQVTLLLKFLKKPGSASLGQVILALDPDTAGQEATLRSLESSWKVFHANPVERGQGTTLFQRQEMPVLKVAPLPPGKDPAEVVSESPEEWGNLVSNAVPLMEYLLEALSSRIDLATPQGKSRVAELLFPLIASTPDPFQQDHYFQILAGKLGVTEATLRASIGRVRRSTPYSGRANKYRYGQVDRPASRTEKVADTPFETLAHDPLEEFSLALILQNPRRFDGDVETLSLQSLREEYFQRVENREVFINWLRYTTLDTLKEKLDENILEHLDYLLAKPLPPSDRKQQYAAFEDCVRRLEVRHLRELKREEELRLSQGSQEELQEQGILQINERIRDILVEKKG